MLRRGVQDHYFGDLRLGENNALLRVDTGGQPVQHHIFYVGLYLRILGGLFDGGESMDVDGTVDAAVLLLQLHPVLQRSQVVSQVQQARGTHTGKDNAFLVWRRAGS